MEEQRKIRLGAGAGYSGDRIDPAIDLAAKGALDYLVFECLAERTIALAQQQKSRDPDTGYDPLLEERMRACLPVCKKNGVKIITNMGAANPMAAMHKTAQLAQNSTKSASKCPAAVVTMIVSAPFMNRRNHLSVSP